jgi:hypothetical protein
LGIRETLNRNSTIGVAAMVCAIAVCAVVIGVELRGNNGKPPAKAYYTTDDGKSWFVDSSSKVPPFDYDGSQAVRCYVFNGPNGKFVGLLEKYDDSTRAELARRAAEVPPHPGSDVSVLVKKPGEKDWKSVGPDQEAMILMHDVMGASSSGVERVMP